MNQFGFTQDQKITTVLENDRFTISAEVIPPRNGAEQDQVLEQIHALTDCGAEFLSVTKGAGGSLRGGSLPIAQAVKERFKVPCIAHFTCRDINPQEVENQLMDHHYFGIRNILALRGDPPFGQPQWTAKEGSYDYAYQLIEQIRKLNAGEYLPRPGGPNVDHQDRTDFCIGAAVYPEHGNETERFEFFKKKVDAGAEFAISQMIFDADAYARFMDQCEKSGISIPILPGTRLLKSKKAAKKMHELFGTAVPEEMLNQLPETATRETLDASVDVFYRYIERLKELGAPGVHLFVLQDTKGSCQFLKKWAE